jgi:hypothetical protein
MATIDSKIYELRTPESYTNPDYEQYEYMLSWISTSGEQYNWLFTDWGIKTKTDTEVLNDQFANSIKSLIQSETTQFELVAEDLSPSEFRVISTILKAKDVFRLYKNGDVERVAVLSNSYNYRQSDQRFSLQIDIELQKKPMPK